jgi:hypothetical protein
MLFLITVLIALTAGFVGYAQTRRFVTSRLRFVDAAQNRLMPVLAGIGATLVALPVVFLLPIVGAGTAIALGLGVGAGAAVGAKDVRLARYKLE